MRTTIRLVVAVMATTFFVVPAAAAAPPEVDVGLVSDIRPVGGSDPRDLTYVGGRVFFSANDDVHGWELWVTDGSQAGTRMVRDVNPGAAGSNPTLLTASARGSSSRPRIAIMAVSSGSATARRLARAWSRT